MRLYYYVYIMASISRTIYVGVTNDLESRVSQHKSGEIESFTQRYKCKKLVYYETYASIKQAIAREKQIKGWRRAKKVALIESLNPHWADLSIAPEIAEGPRGG